MDFYEVLRKRKSVRAYSDREIPEQSLDNIAEAVNLAPSAVNLQPWSFRIVFNEKLRKAICENYKQDWLKQAPAIVLALGNSEEAWKRLEGNSIVDIDIGIAMEHFVLAAAAEGLASCWICAYETEKMNKALNILDPWSVKAVSPLGYAVEDPERRKRKPIKDIFKVVR